MIRPSERELRRAARVFKALSHPDRLRLTCLVIERGSVTQKELVAELGWPQSTVSRHLTALRELGLVLARRQGSEVLLEAARPVPQLLLDVLCDWLRAQGGDLDAVVAEAVREAVP